MAIRSDDGAARSVRAIVLPLSCGTQFVSDSALAGAGAVSCSGQLSGKNTNESC
jgi:hypothetical protein